MVDIDPGDERGLAGFPRYPHEFMALSAPSAACVVARHPEVGVHRVAGQLMATTADGRLHTFEHADGAVSVVGERIIELADGTRTLSALVEQIVGEFDAPADVVEADTLRFVEQLVARNILVLR